MPELNTDYKRGDPQFITATRTTSLSALPAATIARRRRLLRWGGVMTLILGIGFSVIPGPKGSSHTISSVEVNGTKTQVQQFFFSRHLGLPFQTGRIDYNDDGSTKNVVFHGEGFLGNIAVAFAIVVGMSIFLGRRRRDD